MNYGGLEQLLLQLREQHPYEHPYTLALRAQAVTGQQHQATRVKALLSGQPTSDHSPMTYSAQKLFTIDAKLFLNTKKTKIDLDGYLKFNADEIDAMCAYLKTAQTDDQGRVVLKMKGWRRVSERNNKFLSCIAEVMADECDDAAKKLADEFDGELI